MENEILKEQLEKFRLLSKYNTSRTLQENVEDIFEQYKSPEEEIYYTLSRAAGSTWGTDEKLLKQAFSKMKNPGQYKAVENMMSKRPIQGKYKDIATLLNRELESDNAVDFIEIQKMLTPLGINMTASVGKSGRQMNPNTIKVSFGPEKKIGDEPITARGTDTPTGDLAKTKTLPTVVVTGKKKPAPVKPQAKKTVEPAPFVKRDMEGPIKLDTERPELETPGTISPVAPTLTAPQTDLSLEQEFQKAKIELQNAKRALDAAQETRDRAKIGAARGLQQAARKKVQDLRAQLYPPQQ